MRKEKKTLKRNIEERETGAYRISKCNSTAGEFMKAGEKTR